MGLNKVLEDDPFNELSAIRYCEVIRSFREGLSRRKLNAIKEGKPTDKIDSNLIELIDLERYLDLIKDMGKFWKKKAGENRYIVLESIDKLRLAKERIEYLEKENEQLKNNISI